MPVLWRIVKASRLATAFDGEGARRFGGRWNSPGLPAIYASGSKSLALLELLVHLDVSPPVPRLAGFTFQIEDAAIEALAVSSLPRDWANNSDKTQELGDGWLHSRRTLALAVPSAIVPEELNYVINPEHPAFRRLRFGVPVRFALDSRLL